jgi:hypothetical protein
MISVFEVMRDWLCSCRLPSLSDVDLCVISLLRFLTFEDASYS